MRGISRDDSGWTLVDAVITTGLAALMAGLSVPVTTAVIDRHKARAAAGFVAGRFRLARQQAAYETRFVGVVFQQTQDARWIFRICADGNRNGIRKADLGSAVDRCSEGPYDLQDMFPGVRVAVDPLIAGPDGSAASPNPVRFGASQILSFSPQGSGTAGSLYLRSARGSQFSVRVGSATGRTRVLRYDDRARKWSEG